MGTVQPRDQGRGQDSTLVLTMVSQPGLLQRALETRGQGFFSLPINYDFGQTADPLPTTFDPP